MIKLLQGSLTNARPAIDIFRSIHKIEKGDSGHASQYECSNLHENGIIQLPTVGIGKCPGDVEELLLDHLVNVAKGQPVGIANEVELFKGQNAIGMSHLASNSGYSQIDEGRRGRGVVSHDHGLDITQHLLHVVKSVLCQHQVAGAQTIQSLQH